jgi:hypothetical protein
MESRLTGARLNSENLRAASDRSERFAGLLIHCLQYFCLVYLFVVAPNRLGARWVVSHQTRPPQERFVVKVVYICHNVSSGCAHSVWGDSPIVRLHRPKIWRAPVNDPAPLKTRKSLK